MATANARPIRPAPDRSSRYWFFRVQTTCRYIERHENHDVEEVFLPSHASIAGNGKSLIQRCGGGVAGSTGAQAEMGNESSGSKAGKLAWKVK